MVLFAGKLYKRVSLFTLSLILAISGLGVAAPLFFSQIAHASDPTTLFNYIYSNDGISATGTLRGTQIGTSGQYNITSGIITLAGTSLDGTGTLVPNPSSPTTITDTTLGDGTHFIYNDLLTPGSGQQLDSNGLLFAINGIGINLWGNDSTNYEIFGGNYVFDKSNGSFTATAVPEQGSLIVKNVVINTGGGTAVAGDFSFNLNNTDLNQFLQDGDNSLLAENDLSVDPGNYTITEVPGNEAYTISYSNCNDVNVVNNGNFANAPTCTITNTFIPSTQYALTYTAGDHGSITGTTPQAVSSGLNGTAVTAVPATGYHFVNWSDNSSTVATRTDSNVQANISTIASFAINTSTTFTYTYSNGGISATGILTGTQIGNSGQYNITSGTINLTGAPSLNGTGTLVSNPNSPATITNTTIMGGGTYIEYDDLLTPSSSQQLDGNGLFFAIDGTGVSIWGNGPNNYEIFGGNWTFDKSNGSFNATVTEADIIAPTITSSTINTVTKTIVYTLSEPIKFVSQVNPLTITQNPTGLVKIYTATSYANHQIGGSEPTSFGGSNTATLNGNILTVNYTDTLPTDSYLVDAWGYTVTDLAGNQLDESNQKALFDVDNTAPNVPTNGLPSGTYKTTASGWDYTWSNESASGAVKYEYQASRNSARTDGVLTAVEWNNIANGDASQSNLTTPSIPSVGTQDGKWYWQVRAIDVAGNKSDWSPIWNVTVDTHAPTVPSFIMKDSNGVDITNGYINTQYFTVNLTNPLAEEGVVRYQLQYSNDFNSLVWNPSDLSATGHMSVLGAYTDNFTQGEGTHNLAFSACDAAGNCSAYSTLVVTYDNTEPVVTVTTPVAGNYGFIHTVTINANINDAVSYSIYVNSSKVYDGTGAFSPYTLPVIDGTYTIQVKATDAAGNIGTSLVSTITVDDTAPTLTVIGYTGTSLTPTITGTTDGASDIVTVDDIEATVNSNGTWTYTLPTQAIGTHTISVVSTDTYGNAADKSVTVTVTAVSATDTTPATTTTTVTPTGTTTNNTADQGVLGASTTTPNDTTTSADKSSDSTKKAASILGDATAKDNGSIWGLAWYWWLVILAAVAAIIWWIVAAMRSRDNQNA